MNDPGWIYCAVDQRGRVKIGLTRWDTANRRNQLNAKGYRLPWENAPGCWQMVHQRAVADCRDAEFKCHRMLANYRITGYREIFACSRDMAVEVMNAVAANNPTGNPESLLYMLAGGAGVAGWYFWPWIEPWFRWLVG